MLAQAEALARGRTEEEVRHELRRSGDVPDAKSRGWLRTRFIPGNHPSSVILLERLDPRSLGLLIALYEHKVFVQSVIWGINSFDQWGVELGKALAKHMRDALAGGRQSAAARARGGHPSWPRH